MVARVSLTHEEMGKRLARAIFKAGDLAPHDYVQRLQFMGGTYPNAERPLGGFSEMALAEYLRTTLEDWSTGGSDA